MAILTTGSSIGVGLGGAALVVAGVVTAPAWVTVVAVGGIAAGASWGAGYVYDHRNDAIDTIGDEWDAVTPW